MVRKRVGKQVEENVDDLSVGRDDIPGDGKVSVNTKTGLMLPTAMRRRLDREQLEVVLDLQRAVSTAEAAQRAIDEKFVPELLEMRVPWSVISWCTGLTDAGARKRWGTDRG